jgi:hypothetical protein
MMMSLDGQLEPGSDSCRRGLRVILQTARDDPGSWTVSLPLIGHACPIVEKRDGRINPAPLPS